MENSRHQRNQSVPSALQHDDQLARGEGPCLSASDDTDDADYVGKSVSASVNLTLSIAPPFGGCSLQFPSASEDVLSQRECMQDAQVDRNVGVINRHQRNQLMSATTQASEHVEQSSANSDYSDHTDYVDYADDVNESVSANGSQTHGIPPPLAGTSLQFISTPQDLLSQSKDLQDAQDHREVAVINRHQRNQSMSATTQVSDHVGRTSPKWSDYSDYSDYVDYADYANESVSAYWFQTYKPDPPPIGASLQYFSEARDLLNEREDIQGAQGQRVDYADGVINRNQCNQSDLPCSQAKLRVEHNEGEMAVDLNDSSPGKARASPFV